MRGIWLSVLSAVCISLTGCSEPEEIPPVEGWHCEEVLHNIFGDHIRITDTDYALEHMNPMKEYPLDLTEEYLLTGFFQQDISLKAEDASSYNREELKNIPYAEAIYGDSWYFDLQKPEEYIALPEELMPEGIRIIYAPKGNIAVNEREAILISLLYDSDSMVFVWYNGEDPTGGKWNWNEQTRPE